jgi:hypothetical protein
VSSGPAGGSLREQYAPSRRCLRRGAHPNIGVRTHAVRLEWGPETVAREYEPVVGQWYENIEEDDCFRVLAVDEDAELIKIEYLDGDIEEIEADIWAEFDLDKIDQPEGWSGEEVGEPDDDTDDDWDEVDEDDDEEDEDDLDEETDENY